MRDLAFVGNFVLNFAIRKDEFHESVIRNSSFQGLAELVLPTR